MYQTNFVATPGKDKTPRQRQKKEERTLTISSMGGYHHNDVPFLRLSGLWLEDLGFNIGDKVTVHCEDGKLVIQKSEDQQPS